MGIDAQRSGASELPDRAVEVRRAQGATTKAIPVWIVEEEQRRDRPHSGPCNLRRTDDGRAQQDPCALRVAAEPGPRYRASGAAAARPGAVWPSLRCRHRRHTSVWVFVAAARRCAPTSPAPPRLAYGPPALATRPFVLSARTAKTRSWHHGFQRATFLHSPDQQRICARL